VLSPHVELEGGLGLTDVLAPGDQAPVVLLLVGVLDVPLESPGDCGLKGAPGHGTLEPPPLQSVGRHDMSVESSFGAGFEITMRTVDSNFEMFEVLVFPENCRSGGLEVTHITAV